MAGEVRRELGPRLLLAGPEVADEGYGPVGRGPSGNDVAGASGMSRRVSTSCARACTAREPGEPSPSGVHQAAAELIRDSSMAGQRGMTTEANDARSRSAAGIW